MPIAHTNQRQTLKSRLQKFLKAERTYSRPLNHRNFVLTQAVPSPVQLKWRGTNTKMRGDIKIEKFLLIKTYFFWLPKFCKFRIFFSSKYG